MSAKKDSLIKKKLDWTLYTIDCRPAMKTVVEVLAHGAKKYGARNWHKGNTPEFKRELRAAIERHTDALDNGELIDPESKLPHIGHIIASWTFLLMYQLTKSVPN